MKRNRAAYKLFWVTFLCFLLFFVLLMSGQAAFFQHFYVSSKSELLEKRLVSLSGALAEKYKDEGTAAELTGAFMNKNDASLALYDQNFQNSQLYSYRIEVEEKQIKKTILLSGEGIQLNDVPNGIERGRHLTADGFYLDESQTIFLPETIYTSSPGEAPGRGLERIEGTVTEYTLPKDRSFNAYFQDSLADDIIQSWLNSNPDLDSLEKGKTAEYTWTDQWSSIPYITLIHPVELNGSLHYLAVYTSLQPVDDAVDVMKHYFLYAAGAGIILLLFISLFYSRLVTRPLIALSHTAERMARLDFTAKTPVQSKDEFGALAGSLQTLSDNLKTALDELETANLMLQNDVDQKKQLVQLHKEFAGNVSHELKTPLGIIRGFTEGLQDGIADHKRDRYLSHILQETEKMNEMISDLLLLSKYEAAAVDLHLRSFSIRLLLNKVLSTFSGQLSEKELDVHVHDESEGMVYADPKRIEQVLVNFISNAIRHASLGTSIHISLFRIKGMVEIRVENEGEAIPADLLDRIWEKFFRIGHSRSRKSGGTGLGLSIVSQILTLHGSPYGAENTEHGVAFYFRLQESEDDLNE